MLNVNNLPCLKEFSCYLFLWPQKYYSVCCLLAANLTFNLLVNLGIKMFKLICIHCKLFSSASEQQGAEIME